MSRISCGLIYYCNANKYLFIIVFYVALLIIKINYDGFVDWPIYSPMPLGVLLYNICCTGSVL